MAQQHILIDPVAESLHTGFNKVESNFTDLYTRVDNIVTTGTVGPPGPTGATGPAGPTGPTGPSGGGAVATGTGGMTFETRATLEGSTVDGAIKYATTKGYAASGDFGNGEYVRMNVAPTLLASKAYIRTLDRYKFDGSGPDAVNGGYWQLVPHGGREVFIQQFGGKSDFGGVTGNPATATDNYGPLLDAMSFVSFPLTASEQFPFRINFKAGIYWFGDTVESHVHAWIRGMNQEEAADGGTVFFFPKDKTCFIISQNNTSGESGYAVGLSSGGGTILEDFSIRHFYAAGGPQFAHGTFSPYHGIVARGVPIIRNVNLYRIAGHGILIHGNSGAAGALEGNPNQFHIRDSGVHSCGGHALALYGQDANAGSVMGWTTHTEVGGCGIYDDTPYTNTYTGVHIAGFGNRGVSRLGRRYVLLSGSSIENLSTIPQSTTPGDNMDVWFDVGPDDGSRPDIWPAWSSSNTYPLYRLPIWDRGGASVYEGIYVEISNAPSHILPGSTVIGGTIGCTPQSSMVQPDENGVFASRSGIGADRRFEGPGAIGAQGEQYTRNGTRTQVVVGKKHQATAHLAGGFGASGGMQFLSHKRLSDVDAFWEWGYQGNDIAYTSPSGATIWGITTGATTKDHGRGLVDRYRLELYNPVYINPDDSSQMGSINWSNTTPFGAHARGEIIFKTNPVAGGKVGWVCVTSAVVTGGVVTTQAVWKEFGLIDA